MRRLARTTLRLLSYATVILMTASSAAADQFTGTLVVSIVDHVNAPSETLYELRTSSGTRLALEADAVEKIPSSLRKTGATIKVEGALSGSSIVSSQVQVTSPAPAIASDGTIGGLATGERTTALILLNLADAPVECNQAQVDAVYYTDAQSSRVVYEQSSRNQVTFKRDVDGDGNADVFGPFTIAATTGSCDHNVFATQGAAAATTAGVNLNAYQHVVYVLPKWHVVGCTWSGLGELGCGNSCIAWITDCDGINTYAHEIGHNFGMMHASTAAADGTIDCEYCDWSCPMGNGSASVMFNAPHQSEMGWFDIYSDRVVTVSSGGTYQVAPLETDPGSTTLPHMIRIATSGTEQYYFSYRRQAGILNEISNDYADKVSVHRFEEGENTKLIAKLGVGEVFQDAAIDLTVGHTSQNANGATLSISFGDNDLDVDADGYTGAQELADGTDPNDRGSYFPRLSSPVYALWNSFLGMINILELINPASSPSSTTHITVELYSIAGVLQDTRIISLNGGEQYDLILNELSGFVPDSYGVLKLSYTGELEGRVSYYRTGADGGYGFAYSISYAPPLRGTTGVGFNTFQPSLNPGEQANSVFNWLTLVNLDSVQRSYTIRSYNQSGGELLTRTQVLPPFGRVDLDAGHGIAGPSVVGYHEIQPSDDSAPYIAQVIRYGANAAPGFPVSDYHFAFPLTARAGNGRPVHLPISREFGETTWVEIVNTTASSVGVTVTFFDSVGTATTQSHTLPARGQVHLEADASILDPGERGFVTITPNQPNSVIAQSMSYFRDQTTGSIRAMFGIGSREALGTKNNGSYNLFLGMENWLTISNVTATGVTVTLETQGPAGNGSSVFYVDAHKTYSLPIHDGSLYTTQPDSYGFVRVSPATPRSIITDLLRVRNMPDTSIDFAFPTEVRPQ